LWRKTNLTKNRMENAFAEIAAEVRALMNGPVSDEEFSRVALKLFALQHTHNPAYARLCKGRAPQTWQEIPAVPTVAFKELAMTSLAEQDRRHVFYSSGTTLQERSRHFHSEASLALYDESLWRWFNHNFADRLDGKKVVVLTPPAEAAPNSSLAHMFSTFAARHPNGNAVFVGEVDAQGAWQIDFPKAVELLEDKATPLALFGTAFLFVNLLDELEKRAVRCRLAPGSWIMETGGYKGRSREVSKADFHRMISERLDVTSEFVFGEYGMSELSSQAYDGGDGVFKFPPWARARIVSPVNGREVDVGERGLIRIYDLANVWSVMAVQTEDVAIKRAEGFELCGRASQAEARGCSLMSA
jgi:hypothetical protein